MPDPWRRNVRNIVKNTIVVNGVDVDLAKEASKDLALTVYADTVRIMSPVSINGQSVFIHARQIICGENGLIDVSGYSHTVQRQDLPGNEGKHGKNGEVGAEGGSGGNIRIYAGQIDGVLSIDVRGGRGGPGQNGGYGLQGDKGPDGRSGKEMDSNHSRTGAFPGEPGQKGGTGGNAGLGGLGGKGGDAGTIEVYVIAHSALQFNFQGKGGEPGEMGKPGNSGQGGPPGLGGENWRHRIERHATHPGFETESIWEVTGRASNLGQGDWGTIPKSPENNPKGLSYTKYAEYVHPASFRDLGSNASISQMLMLLHLAEKDYLNTSYESSAKRLDWLEKLTQLAPPDLPSDFSLHDLHEIYPFMSPVASEDMKNEGEKSLANDPNWQQFNRGSFMQRSLKAAPISEIQTVKTVRFEGNLPYSFGLFDRSVSVSHVEWLALRERVLTLLNQLHRGLDFYGYASDYVPLVNMAEYSEAIERLLPMARDIDNAQKDYSRAAEGSEEKRDTLQRCIEKAQEEIAVQVSEITRLETEAKVALEEMQQLESQLINLETPLKLAGSAFEKAVEEHIGTGCTTLDTLEFIGAVIAISAGAYSEAATIVDKAKGSVDAMRKIHGTVKVLKLIKGSIEEIKKEFRSVKDEVRSREHGVKLLWEEKELEKQLEAFNKTIDRFTELEETAHYKALTELYVRTALARNKKAKDSTDLAAKRTKVLEQIAHRRQELQRIHEQFARAVDYGLAEYVVFIDGLFAQARSNLLNLLHKYKKALEYWSMVEDQSPLNFDSVGEISGTYLNLKNEEFNKREERNSSERKLDPRPQVVLTGNKGNVRPNPNAIFIPEAFQSFRELRNGAHTLIFTIPVSHPAFMRPWAGITVSEVAIQIPNIKTSDKVVAVELIHSGSATFGVSRDASGTRNFIRFTHRPRRNAISFRTDETATLSSIEDNLGGGRGYAYLSPFSVWRLSISPVDNRDLEIGSNVEEVILTFGGYFVPFMVS